MTTIVSHRSNRDYWPIAAWLPLAILPFGAGMLTAHSPAWVQMWALAISIYASLKWLTFARSGAARCANVRQSLGYLFLWTGMDPDTFFGQRQPTVSPQWSQWVWAFAQTAIGLAILFWLAPPFIESHPVIAGWLTMTGVVSILHFGVSQLLSLAWRTAGVNAQHIMHKPVFARSLADFWGSRWNLAFRDLAYQLVLKPLAPRIGMAGATMAVFFVSGLIHDVVISLAARGGWGLPTLYFLIQGAALLLERSPLGRRFGLGRGVLGRFYAAVVVIGPAGLLFHPPFMTRVVVPMLEALVGATQ
jgi:alginate O-acetyltransferase complex protein AlgI